MNHIKGVFGVWVLAARQFSCTGAFIHQHFEAYIATYNQCGSMVTVRQNAGKGGVHAFYYNDDYVAYLFM